MNKLFLSAFFGVAFISVTSFGNQTVSLLMNVTNLKVGFTKSGAAQNTFSYAGLSMTCEGHTNFSGTVVNDDCSQNVKGPDGKSTLTYQVGGTQGVFTMNLADADGNIETSVIHAQLLESGNMTAMENGAPVVYVMTDADAKNLVSHYRVTDADVQAGLKITVKNQGRVILSGDAIEVDYPDFDMSMNINAN